MNCQDHLYRNADPRPVARRWFFQQCGVGLGAIALRPVCCGDAGLRPRQPGRLTPANPLAPKPPHFAPKAKRVIFLFMAGAPSHLELFDNKPQLAKFDGTLAAAGAAEGLSGGVHQSQLEAAGSEVQVRPARQCGAELSELLPHLADRGRRHRHRQVDGHRRVQPRARPDPDEHRLAALRPARASALGLYGLGSESHDLPGFVVFSSGRKGPAAATRTGAAASCRPSIRACSSAPAATRCCICRTPGRRRASCSATRSTRSGLNQLRLEQSAIPEIATRINSFEMAFRMQTSAPEVMDLSQEPQAHPGAVRRRAGQAVVRQQLPAGPAAGRARRAVRAAVPRGLGPARQPGRTTSRRTARTPTRPARP